MAYQPKNYRKFVATAATATLVASAIAPVASAADFKDVSSKYKEAVDFVVSKGASGTSATTFGTDANIKRGDAAVLLAKVLGLDTDAPDAGFTDVNSRLDPYVNALKEAGITSGKTKTTFAPDALITRGELAVWIQKGFDLEGTSDLKFIDVNTNYQTAVQALVANGVTTGISSTAFGTTQNAKRGDYALFLYRADQATAEDTTAPELKYDGSTSVTIENGADFTVPTVTASDNVDKDVKVTHVITDASGKQLSAIDTEEAGTYKITYSATDTAGNKAEDLVITVTVKEPATPAVASVEALNATQVQVKFNTAIDEDTLFNANGTFKATVSMNTLDNVESGALSGVLGTDGKTLTITSENPLSKRYDVKIDGVKAKDGKAVTTYQEVVTIAEDKTAPTIVSTTKNSATSFTVKFSEPIKSLGTVSYKLADGTVVTGGPTTISNDFKAGAQEVNFTLGENIAAGKEVVATFIGAQDQNSNLLTPNPATVSFTKGVKDGVAPTVSSITQTGATTFAVKFSEALLNSPTITIDNATPSKIEKSSTDATVYNVTASSALDGAKTIAVSGHTDLSGEAGAAYSKVVTFTKDTVAPKVTSSNVIVSGTDNKQYLEITFDKDVNLASGATVDGTGSYVKDYVTTTIGDTALTATAVTQEASNKKAVRVELDSFLGTTYDVEGAVYNLDLTFNGVTSLSGVAAETAKTSFTRGKDGVPQNNEVVKVTKVEQDSANNSKVNVTFDKAVDGASATNPSNYKIDGAVVESVTLSPVSGTTQVAVLNLKADSNAFTGPRNIEISGVKALGSTKTMETYRTNEVTLKENVAPTVSSAKLTSTTGITLTFSEVVTEPANATAADFELLVGGKSRAAVSNVDVTVNANTNTATITFTNALTAEELAKGLSLKALDTLDITDDAGNKVTAPTNITVTQ